MNLKGLFQRENFSISILEENLVRLELVNWRYNKASGYSTSLYLMNVRKGGSANRFLALEYDYVARTV